MPRKSLTQKQKDFLGFYADSNDPEDAYRKAYGSVATKQVAYQEGRKLLSNPLVQEALGQVVTSWHHKRAEIAQIYQADKASLVQFCMQVIYRDKAIGGRLPTMNERLKAVDTVANLMGYKSETRNLRIVRSISDLSDAELQAIAAGQLTIDGDSLPADGEVEAA